MRACETRGVQSGSVSSPVSAQDAPPAVTGVRPRLTLGLLSVQHALIHGQSALYPLVYLAIIDEFGITPATIVILSTVGSIASGLLQYTFGALTRWITRRSLLGVGGLAVGIGTALQAAGGFALFSAANVVSRVGGAPQHPVGNALLAEQYPARRIGTAIAVHVAGGNVGTVVVGFAAAVAIAALGWRGAVLALGLATVAVAILILGLVRETGADRAHAADAGTIRQLYRRVLADRDLRWLFTTAVLGGGSRGLGVLNIFVPLYLDRVLGLDAPTIGLMYGVLLAASVPGPLVAGWLSDRVGRKPVIIGVYLAGAVAISFFVLAGRDPMLLWTGVVLLSLFSFVESPQLQALLADVTDPGIRDAAYSTYFALAFGVGSFWGILYGIVVDADGPGSGLGTVFWIMAGASVAAAAATLRIGIHPLREAVPPAP
jgi:MFS family permease